MRSEPQNARTLVWALSLSLAATQEIDLSFSSSGYLDVSVPQVPFHTLWIGVWILKVSSSRFPHSDISGSRDICSSPKLFAAYHVFHRLLVPRHPPYALISITKRFRSTGMDLPLHMYSVTCVGNRPIVLLRFLRRTLSSRSLMLLTLPRMSCIRYKILSH